MWNSGKMCPWQTDRQMEIEIGAPPVTNWVNWVNWGKEPGRLGDLPVKWK